MNLFQTSSKYWPIWTYQFFIVLLLWFKYYDISFIYLLCVNWTLTKIWKQKHSFHLMIFTFFLHLKTGTGKRKKSRFLLLRIQRTKKKNEKSVHCFRHNNNNNNILERTIFFSVPISHWDVNRKSTISIGKIFYKVTSYVICVTRFSFRLKKKFFVIF